MELDLARQLREAGDPRYASQSTALAAGKAAIYSLGKDGLEIAAGELAGPFVAAWEITTGTNIYGEDIGPVGRAFALAGALPGGKIVGKLVKAIRKVDDVAETAVKQSTKRTADLAQKAVRQSDHAIEAVGDLSRQSSKRAEEVAKEARERAVKKKEESLVNTNGNGNNNTSGGDGGHSKPTKVEIEIINPDFTPKVSGSRTAAQQGVETVQRAMSRAELESIQRTGLLSRGGRLGDFFVSPSVNSNANRARQRLALPNRPEVRVTLEVPTDTFSPPSTVQPFDLPSGRTLPGGGLERTAPGNIDIPVRILGVDNF